MNIVGQIESPEDTGNDAIKFQVEEDFYLFKWVQAQKKVPLRSPSGMCLCAAHSGLSETFWKLGRIY